MPPGKRKSASQRRAEKTKSLVEGESVDDYRHGDKRKNIPNSGQADDDTVARTTAEESAARQGLAIAATSVAS